MSNEEQRKADHRARMREIEQLRRDGERLKAEAVKPASLNRRVEDRTTESRRGNGRRIKGGTEWEMKKNSNSGM